VLLVRKDGKYIDVSGLSDSIFANDSRAFSIVDFDGDGRPDIVLKSRLGPQVRFLQNDWTGENHSIAFSLRGTKSNRDAIGAHVEVDGRRQVAQRGIGILSQHSKRMIFGLGALQTAARVRITWPSGAVQEFSNLKAGRTYTVVEGSTEITEKEFRQPHALPAGSPRGDTASRSKTRVSEPIPLPEPQRGPGLFVIVEQRAVSRFSSLSLRLAHRITRALALLLNARTMVKVYAKTLRSSSGSRPSRVARFSSV